MDEIVRMVKVLPVGGKHKVAMPAGWPGNELIRDRVTIPPATDEKTAAGRPKQYGCCDW